ncbi:DUF1559 domain-containing protein [Tundrisphaera lichenicola]|uniref:DUF1559 family PulG-like putative transporter n=1 Tax=Tundrisphaera lichenicola TaxID=2029860 RepID=UPI003EB8CAAF
MSRTFLLILGVIGLFVLVPLGLAFPSETLYSLAFGWIYFLGRVVPGVTVDRGGLAIGATCLVLVALLAHSFFGWLYRQVRGPEGAGWRVRWTASMVGTVVLMFAAGIAATGIVHQAGWLLTSTEPWIGSSWIVGYRVESTNNLKQIGLALFNYESTYGAYPPAATLDDEGRLLHGWQARVLPFLDQEPLYNQINFAVPWDDPRNQAAFKTPARVYLNPRIKLIPGASGLAPSHYAGNALVLGGDTARTIKSIPDGTSNTFLAGEVADQFKPWGYPANWRDPARGINKTPEGFGSPFPGGANFLMADGSVRFIRDNIEAKVFRAMSTPDGGEVIGVEEY